MTLPSIAHYFVIEGKFRTNFVLGIPLNGGQFLLYSTSGSQFTLSLWDVPWIPDSTGETFDELKQFASVEPTGAKL